MDYSNLETNIISCNRTNNDKYGFVNTPIYRGSTVLFPTVKKLINYDQEFVYGRFGSPTTKSLEDSIKSIDNSDAVFLCPSGLAAISFVLQATLSPGDHILVLDTVYNPVKKLCNGTLSRLGIIVSWVDPNINEQEFSRLLTENTKAVYLEAPGSLTMEIPKFFPSLIRIANDNDVIVIIDNTWATPFFFDGIKKGVDIIIQSATKYILGHSDAMLGIVSSSKKTTHILKNFYRETGLCISPDDAWLALRGIKTLKIRLEKQYESALTIANWLKSREEVQDVWYPALETDPNYEQWKSNFSGAASLFSIVLQPKYSNHMAIFLESLKLFSLGYSWGGFESLVLPFDVSSNRKIHNIRHPLGPSIRFYIGLENVNDLLKDLESSFNRINITQNKE